MRKSILPILVMIALWTTGVVYAEETAKLFPKEWSVIEKIPSAKGGLAIGVFLFEEGMPTEHIRYVFGDPQEIITLDAEEGSQGAIWVYPHHYFFFSKTGSLQAIKERDQAFAARR